MVRVRTNQNNGFSAFSTGYILLGVLGFGILYFVVDKISLDGGIHFGKSLRYDEQQKKTLWKFYEDLGGDDWKWPRSTYKKPWREEEEVCTWSGIVCDDPDSGIVTSISFMGKNLKGKLEVCCQTSNDLRLFSCWKLHFFQVQYQQKLAC